MGRGEEREEEGKMEKGRPQVEEWEAEGGDVGEGEDEREGEDV